MSEAEIIARLAMLDEMLRQLERRKPKGKKETRH
jgi:hypothetical protein